VAIRALKIDQKVFRLNSAWSNVTPLYAKWFDNSQIWRCNVV